MCNRRQKTIRSTRVKHRKKDQNFKIKYVTLLCYCFFFSTVIKFYSPVKICHYLNRVQCLQLSHNCDNENRQCADNQCPQSGVDNIWEFVTRETEKWLLSVLTGVRIKRVNFTEIYELFVGTNETVCIKWVSVLSGCP